MRIAIVGPGSIGSLFASKLVEGGADAFLIDYKEDRAAEINATGISIEWEGDKKIVPVKATANPAGVVNADGIIFTVKSYSTEKAALRIKASVNGDAWLMSLQNGMGNTEILAAIFGEGRILAGTTSEGATLKAPGKVRHAGLGETWVGELDGSKSERIKALSELLVQAGFKGGVSDNVTALLWKKLIINAGINPVTALLRIKNGEILDREIATEVMAVAALETAAVAKAAGVDLGDIDPVALVEGVAKKTAENISSMHQDVAAGRLTEIDFISNYVAKTGEKVGVNTQMNTALGTLIAAIHGKKSDEAEPV